MNRKQNALCLVVICLVIGMGIYPPHILHARVGVILNLGYNWIFSPPDAGTIDTTLLMTQWLGTLIVGGIALFLLKK